MVVEQKLQALGMRLPDLEAEYRRNQAGAHFASHLDVNAIVCCEANEAESLRVQEEAVGNLKRVVLRDRVDWHGPEAESPYPILDTVEVKTTWHPVGS